MFQLDHSFIQSQIHLPWRVTNSNGDVYILGKKDPHDGEVIILASLDKSGCSLPQAQFASHAVNCFQILLDACELAIYQLKAIQTDPSAPQFKQIKETQDKIKIALNLAYGRPI